MKRLSIVLLSAIITLSACHNDSSSTVGVYENDEPKEKQEHNTMHEGNMMNEEHKTDTVKAMHEGADTATHSKAESKM